MSWKFCKGKLVKRKLQNWSWYKRFTDYVLTRLAYIGGMDGISNEDWNNMTILQRMKVYDWSKELIIVGFIAVYIILHYIGVGINRRKVTNWVKVHKEVLSSQFYQVGSEANKEGQKDQDLVICESPISYIAYATGRIDIKCLTGNFDLLGRQNFITLAMEYIFDFFSSGSTPGDKIRFVITPSNPSAIEGFVFAVVNKSCMRAAREDNYFLSLTKTSDSAKLPTQFSFMSESAEITDIMYSKELADAIKDSGNVLQFLAISDLPEIAPSKLSDLVSSPKVEISLKFPSNEKEATASAKILDAAINLVDVLVSKKPFRSEVSKKTKATRDAELKKAQKNIEFQKQEQMAIKKAELKREQEANIAKLSPAEQRKAEQKEREKDLRRQRNKQTKKG